MKKQDFHDKVGQIWRVLHLKGGWGQEFPHLWGQKLTSGFFLAGNQLYDL